MECWLELVEVGKDRVRFVGHNLFTTTGEDVVSSSELHFRSQAEVTDSLIEASFAVEHMHGDWSHGPLTSRSRVMVFIARRV